MAVPRFVRHTVKQASVPVPPRPEQLARSKIDEQLEACRWVALDITPMNIHADPGVAVRESPLERTEDAQSKKGWADYLWWVSARALGVIKANPACHALQGRVGALKEIHPRTE